MRLNKQKVVNLIVGVVGVLTIYWFNGIFHEALIKGKYTNSETGQKQIFESMIALVYFPSLITWVGGVLWDCDKTDKTKIPVKNSFYCGLIVFISNLTSNLGIKYISFPVLMAIKSSSILAVLLVAILCTRVKATHVKISPKKIFIGIIITIGVFIFGFFDPSATQRETENSIFGFGMILISLFADGFLPDFQAEIKTEYNPEPTQMMTQINKFITIVGIVFHIISLNFVDFLFYIISHPEFLIVAIGFSFTGLIGQIFIYRLIKQFRQHIVPVVVTVRKIFAVFISIIFFKHETNIYQIIGMLIVSSAIIAQFIRETQNKREKEQEKDCRGEMDNNNAAKIENDRIPQTPKVIINEQNSLQPSSETMIRIQD